MFIKSLSASAYSAYDYCQWKFFLTSILGMEDKSGSAALLGNVCHSAFEEVSIASINQTSKDHEVFDPEKQWNKWFSTYLEKNPVLGEAKADKIKKIKKGFISVFNSEYTPISIKTLAVEQYFRIPLDEEKFRLAKYLDKEQTESIEDVYFTIRGLIDRVEQVDKDTIEIIDYKSGSRASFGSDSTEKKDNITLKDEIQPRMYHLAAKILYPDVKNFLVTFIYFCDGGPVSVPFCDDDISVTKDMIHKRLKEITRNSSPSLNRSWRCKYCFFDYDNSGICPKIWNEKEQNGIEFVTNKYKILNNK